MQDSKGAQNPGMGMKRLFIVDLVLRRFCSRNLSCTLHLPHEIANRRLAFRGSFMHNSSMMA